MLRLCVQLMETEESPNTLQIMISFIIYMKKVCKVLMSLDYGLRQNWVLIPPHEFPCHLTQ